MNIVVYTGSSISHADAKKILDADYRKPVKRNDIKRLIDPEPDIIGIIDGVFFNSAAIAHREIIEAIKNGITIVGGGSMGALRASELDSYGMIGVGKIYEMFRSGELESDDEVAVTFDPDTLKTLSTPLVNIRLTLEKANNKGIITEEQSSSIIRVTKNIFYPDRNFRNIVNECVKKGIIEEELKESVLSFFQDNEVDVKREDAVLVLEKIKEMNSNAIKP